MRNSCVEAVVSAPSSCAQNDRFINNRSVLSSSLCLNLRVIQVATNSYVVLCAQPKAKIQSVLSSLYTVYTGSISPTTKYLKGVIV